MTGWPRWDSATAPGALAQYVQRGVVVRLLPADLAVRLPGPSGEPALERARRIYEVLAELGIAYVDEPTESTPGRQVIRPPDQVLSRPRQGTCLDLAVVFAGACLDAGLHPVIVLLDPVRRGDPAHALMAVWLRGDWAGRPSPDYPLTEKVQADPPYELAGDLCAGPGEPGAFAAIDVEAAARRPGDDNTPAVPASWQAALAAGARMVTEASGQSPVSWRWWAGIDVGLAWDSSDVLMLPRWPSHDPLIAAYLGSDPHAGPLDQMRARRGLVKFYGRDELDVLQDWCQEPGVQDPPTRIAVVHGVGGSGKTHLAAELCARLTRQGWYTGFLPREPDPADLAWFGTVVSPLLVVVDYAEDAKAADIRILLRAVQGRAEPTCVLLTARAIGGWWDEVARDLRDSGHAYDQLPLRLPDRHPRTTGVFRTALRTFATAKPSGDPDVRGKVPPVTEMIRPPAGRWTTLDLIMLAWLAATGTVPLPASHSELYEEILRHEIAYWRRTFSSRYGPEPVEDVLRAAGACVTLLAPTPENVSTLLTAVAELGGQANARYRGEVAQVLRDLLPPDPGDNTIALRPDPVGDHLMLTVLASDQKLLRKCLKRASDTDQLHACLSLTRAAQEDTRSAVILAEAALRARTNLWRPALAVAGSQGGPFVPALERLADREDTPLPLAELDATLPTGHGTLCGLALIAAQRTVDRLRSAGTSGQDDHGPYAAAVNNLAVRLGDVGRRDEALEAAQEAVGLYRDLAEHNPAAYLPGLAASVTNLAARLGDVGRRDEALEAAQEAVGLYRDLAEHNPAAYLPNLAISEDYLAIELAGAGRGDEALAAAREAVTIRRDLAGRNPAAHLVGLAASVGNLAVRLGDVGRRDKALEAAQEAVGLYRDLAEHNPAAYLPDQAAAVSNLAGHLAEAGRRDEALAAAREAVTIRRDLAGRNPAAYLPDLAASVTNVAIELAGAGRGNEALVAAQEAAGLYRDLAEQIPAAYLPGLAASVGSLANRLGDVGRRDEALAAAREAVTIHRDLAGRNPAAYLPGLAASVGNLAKRLGDVGRGDEALEAAQEAVGLYRDLAEHIPAAYLPGLAASVDNLANRLGDVGRRDEALAAAQEAVTIHRDLAGRNPAAYLPGLAASVGNLANWLAEAGRGDDALAAGQEAMGLYSDLAGRNRAAYLSDLAISVSNLANRLGDVGRRDEALAAAQKAVGLYRDLAEHDLAGSNPAAYLPDLAASVSNLAGRLTGAGRRDEALAAGQEAVGLYRDLAEHNPAAYLPDQAASVTNLAVQLAGAGRQEEALAAAQEAVGLYRDLARANPAAYLPGLAASVNNLAVQLAGAGRQEQALAAAQEAVSIRRDLAGRNPAAYLPGLATSVSNLAGRLAEAERQDEALVAAEEAVSIRRDLAGRNPAAYLPDLATSVGNLANQLAEAGRQEEALRIFEAVGESLRPGARAELLIGRFAWRRSHGDQAAIDDLRDAAAAAEEELDRGWAGRARRAVRAGAEGAGSSAELADLPAWATAELPESIMTMLNGWLAAADWAQQEEFLRTSNAGLLTPESRDALLLTTALYPDLAKLTNLSSILAEIASRGVDAVLAELGAAHGHVKLVHDWLATSTWTESRDFLAAHPELIADLRTVDVLRAYSGDPVIDQHVAVVRLCQRMPLAEVYDLAADVSMAVDAATDAAEAGDRATLTDIWAVAPNLGLTPFAGPYLAAIHMVLQDSPKRDAEEGNEPIDASRLMEIAAEQGTDAQRAAGSARLRRLARKQPSHAESLNRLAEILAAGPASSESQGTTDTVTASDS
jgi:Tetratricopeptide repeat